MTLKSAVNFKAKGKNNDVNFFRVVASAVNGHFCS